MLVSSMLRSVPLSLIQSRNRTQVLQEIIRTKR